MQKYGFTIRTRGGSLVSNLVIQGRDEVEAEKKLRQVYHHCTILQARPLEDPVDASDFEAVISLIASEGRKPEDPDKPA